jgi:hypothetical protein
MATPTIAALTKEVAEECGLLLADAGVYLTADDGSTPAISQGIRRGLKAVRQTPADPLVPADSDLLGLSTYAVERVLDEAKLHALQIGHLQLYRAAQADQEPFSAEAVSSGWRMTQLRLVERRISELKAVCDTAYREPGVEFTIAHRYHDDPARRPFVLDAACPWPDYPDGFGAR